MHAVRGRKHQRVGVRCEAAKAERCARAQESSKNETPTGAAVASKRKAHGCAACIDRDLRATGARARLYTSRRMQPDGDAPLLRIHVIEDDEDIREETVFALSELGFEALGFAEATSFYKAFAVAPCDIAVVDIGLPGESGLSIVSHLRAARGVGVVLFTARGSVQDRVLGLREGADAYLVKPVNMMELAETLRAVGRRLHAERGVGASSPGATERSAAQWSLREGGWVVSDPNGRRMTLTATERSFLGCLFERRGAAVSRDDLIVALGGNVFDFDQHRIDAMASRLRRKAEKLGMRLPVHSVRGTGYVFAS